MSKKKMAIGLLLAISNCGCSTFDRADRLRSFELDGGKKVGINVTDATRRLAVIYPSGRICSELSPPAVLEFDRTFNGDVTAGAKTASFGGSSKSSAVTLTTSTEKIECLRISLFHACALAGAENMDANQEISLYEKAIKNCYAQ